MGETATLSCKSRIDRVTVYARGAVVVRTVELPAELSSGPCVLEVGLGRPALDPRSLRAIPRGGRSVLAIDVRPRIQAAPQSRDLGPLEREVERLEREHESVRARLERLSARRGALTALWPDPRLRPRRADEDGAARVRDALAANAMIDGMLDELHAHLRDEERREALVLRALEAAKVARDRASSADAPSGQDELAALVQLGEGAASPLESLEIEYVVDAARWWPAYRVRLSDSARLAHWTLDAYVAQASGEDWAQALVSLSTADLVRDARLPTLPTLRIGRAQRKITAFRPPPSGLDELFAGYDGHGADLRRPEPVDRTIAPKPIAMIADVLDARAGSDKADRFDDADEVTVGADAGALEQGEGALREEEAVVARAPAAAAFARQSSIESEKKESRARGGASPLGWRAEPSAPPRPQEASGEGAPSEIDPDERWLEYDGLELEEPSSARANRGRLTVSQSPSDQRLELERAYGRSAIERLVAPSGTVDPRAARSTFDHLYDGGARVDVIADGALHRVSIAQAEGRSRPRFRAVPKEDPAVYREAEVQNPFESPLLAGPAEVFSDDALVARTAVAAVDRGGTIALGLGVEERLRVARNAKVLESATGLLGGSTQVEHTISIELASSLGEAVFVDVIDRVPVAKRDSEIEVTVLSSKPKATAYSQADRGSPVDGVARWTVELAPGTKSSIEFAYRIVFASKLEIVGGNRRD